MRTYLWFNQTHGPIYKPTAVILPSFNDNQFLLSTYQNLKNSNKILEFKSDTKLMAFIKKDAFHLDYISNGEMLDDNLKRVQIKSFMQLKLAEKQRREELKRQEEKAIAEQKKKSKNCRPKNIINLNILSWSEAAVISGTAMSCGYNYFSVNQLADHYGRYQYGQYINNMFYAQMAKAHADRYLCQIYKREYVDCVN